MTTTTEKLKYAIDLGHGVGRDGGAVGLVREEDWINQVGKLLIGYLQELGHEVVETRPQTASSVSSSLRQRCDRANSTKCDVFVSLHANAFSSPNANGAEVFAISTRAQKIAAGVLQQICDLGFRNRGVKSQPQFQVLRDTTMLSILIEMGFITSPRDVALFNAKRVARAICKGLTGEVPPDTVDRCQ